MLYPCSGCIFYHDTGYVNLYHEISFILYPDTGYIPYPNTACIHYHEAGCILYHHRGFMNHALSWYR